MHKLNTKNCVLPHFRMERGDDATIKEIRTIFIDGNKHEYKKREVLISQGTPVDILHFLMEGLIEYTYADSLGTEHLIEICAPGNILCLQGFFGKQQASGSFIALTDVVTTTISIGEINNLINNNPRLAREFLEEMGRVVNGLIRQIHAFSIPAQVRVGQILFLIANEYCRSKPSAKRVLVDLSQEDIGRMAKTTRVTVTKCLRVLKKMELISTGYGGIFVENMAGLNNWLNRQFKQD